MADRTYRVYLLNKSGEVVHNKAITTAQAVKVGVCGVIQHELEFYVLQGITGRTVDGDDCGINFQHADRMDFGELEEDTRYDHLRV